MVCGNDTVAHDGYVCKCLNARATTPPFQFIYIYAHSFFFNVLAMQLDLNNIRNFVFTLSLIDTCQFLGM